MALPKERQLPVAYIGDLQEFNRIWHLLRDHMNEGRVIDLVIIARTEVPDGDEELYPGIKYLISKYWHGGDSCIGVLGMLQYMINEVMDYM